VAARRRAAFSPLSARFRWTFTKKIPAIIDIDCFYEKPAPRMRAIGGGGVVDVHFFY
tara:strand:- start:571 stop:741 length:171 start_codon:yes stop_codon:yes gene_type:complete